MVNIESIIAGDGGNGGGGVLKGGDGAKGGDVSISDKSNLQSIGEKLLKGAKVTIEKIGTIFIQNIQQALKKDGSDPAKVPNRNSPDSTRKKPGDPKVEENPIEPLNDPVALKTTEETRESSEDMTRGLGEELSRLQQELASSERARLELEKSIADTKEDIVIMLIGGTGSGKSSLIRSLTKDTTIALSHNLQSATKEVQTYRFFDAVTIRNIQMIDTPGFDSSHFETDRDVLKNITKFLLAEYNSGRKLNGLIFLHRISDPVLGNQSIHTINLFKGICGTRAYKNVVVMTSFWSQVTNEVGERREAHLRGMFFQELIQGGALFMRHDETNILTALSHFSTLVPTVIQIQQATREKEVGSIHRREVGRKSFNHKEQNIEKKVKEHTQQERQSSSHSESQSSEEKETIKKDQDTLKNFNKRSREQESQRSSCLESQASTKDKIDRGSLGKDRMGLKKNNEHSRRHKHQLSPRFKSQATHEKKTVEIDRDVHKNIHKHTREQELQRLYRVQLQAIEEKPIRKDWDVLKYINERSREQKRKHRSHFKSQANSDGSKYKEAKETVEKDRKGIKNTSKRSPKQEHQWSSNLELPAREMKKTIEKDRDALVYNNKRSHEQEGWWPPRYGSQASEDGYKHKKEEIVDKDREQVRKISERSSQQGRRMPPGCELQTSEGGSALTNLRKFDVEKCYDLSERLLCYAYWEGIFTAARCGSDDEREARARKTELRRQFAREFRDLEW